MTYHIIIDTREDQTKIKEILMKYKYDIDMVDFQALPFGDFLIERNGKTLLIERKEMSDLISSIFSKGSSKGTLKAKLFQMQSMADEIALLIEGNYTLKYNKVYINPFVPMIPYTIIARFLDHRGLNEKIPIIHTRSLEETIMRLHLIATDKGEMAPCKLRSVDQILTAFPKIGPKGLEKLKKKYASPRDAFEHISEWAKILDLENW